MYAVITESKSLDLVFSLVELGRCEVVSSLGAEVLVLLPTFSLTCWVTLDEFFNSYLLLFKGRTLQHSHCSL